MKKSLAAYAAAVALVALAMFAPTNASAQVNIYVGPGGYAHYGYGGILITDIATATVLSMDTAMATILSTATAITADIEATTVAIGAMGVG